VGIAEERATRDADVEAFFALSRVQLLLGAIVLLAAAFGAMWYALIYAGLGVWTLFVLSGWMTLCVACARRSPIGRGALWALTRPWGGIGDQAPTVTLRVGLFFTTLFLSVHLAAWAFR
jgi:hypothetical protein